MDLPSGSSAKSALLIYVTVRGTLGTSRWATPIRGGHLTTFPYIYSFLYCSLVNHHLHYIYIKLIFYRRYSFNSNAAYKSTFVNAIGSVGCRIKAVDLHKVGSC